MLPERREPTHRLLIEIPLHLADDVAHTVSFNPVQDALRIALSLSRAAVGGHYCADPEVSLLDLRKPA